MAKKKEAKKSRARKPQPKEARIVEVGKFMIEEEPYYHATGDEKKVFEVTYENRMPFAAVGPTGCGKTRFIHYMSWATNQKAKTNYPLFFMTCHEDLTATDLLGRDRIDGSYLPGIAQRWAKTGGILYLDEVVEARPDLGTLLHPMMEPGRRVFYNERTGNVVELHPDCMLAVSWNPAYQDITKDLKPSTRQRLVTHRFGYPPEDIEQRIVATESGLDDSNMVSALVKMANDIRGMKEGAYTTLKEGASTRLLIYAATLIRDGVDPTVAVTDSILNPLTDDRGADTYEKLQKVLTMFSDNYLGRRKSR
jgi:nitric oxide reductase NorQ protein